MCLILFYLKKMKIVQVENSCMKDGGTHASLEGVLGFSLKLELFKMEKKFTLALTASRKLFSLVRVKLSK